MSVPPLGTRPGVCAERDALLEQAYTYGLTLRSGQIWRAPVPSPPFERAAMRASGLLHFVPNDWRQGDSARFERTGSLAVPRPAVRWRRWSERAIGGVRVRVDQPAQPLSEDPRLRSVVDGDVLQIGEPPRSAPCVCPGLDIRQQSLRLRRPASASRHPRCDFRREIHSDRGAFGGETFRLLSTRNGGSTSVQMMADSWSRPLLERVEIALDQPSGQKRVFDLSAPVRVHLAIFVEPYLSLVIDGKKTIESRFGVHMCAPHGRVSPNDLLLLKRASGPVIGVCQVAKTWFFDLRTTALDGIRERFARQLCAEDPAFWLAREHASYATLMKIDRVTAIEPIAVQKRDRRGWVVVREPSLFDPAGV